MAVFRYKAINGQGAGIAGTVTADSPRHARDDLRGRGLTVQRILEEKPRKKLVRSALWARFGNTRRVAGITRELGTLLEVGLPVTEAIGTLCNEKGGRLNRELMLLREHVVSGSSLADAMAQQPVLFDELTVAMVAAGEESGTLDLVLRHLSDFKERSLELKDRVINALIYPSLVFLCSVVVTLFLMTVVVPMLLTNLVEMGRPLPWPTRVLKGFSDLLLQHGLLISVVLVLCLAVVSVGIKTPRGRYLWHRTMLRMPLLGKMIKLQSVSRLALVMATLIRSGTVYLTALEIAARSVPNTVIREAFQQSGESVRAGREIGDSLHESGIFPSLVVHVFSVGQKSGRLVELLMQLSDNYERQLATMSARLPSVIEPVLIIILSVVVGFILFATLLPILEAGNVLGTI